MAERVARHLSERLGDEAVTAHHGSLSKEKRLDAETRLKSGRLKALVATASLELGIDIGHVDLVCQIGSPHRIATLLQRVGRSGHTIAGTPKGRVFPVSRDDLVECAALLRAIRRGELDRIVVARRAARRAGAADRRRDGLPRLRRGRSVRAGHARLAVPRPGARRVRRGPAMTSDGFATRRGRRGALVHRDEVNATLRGRRGARLLARPPAARSPRLPTTASPRAGRHVHRHAERGLRDREHRRRYLPARQRVVARPAGRRRRVRVADAKGAPPSIPFWLGEAPARSDELSRAVSDLRAELDRRLDDPAAAVGRWSG